MFSGYNIFAIGMTLITVKAVKNRFVKFLKFYNATFHRFVKNHFVKKIILHKWVCNGVMAGYWGASAVVIYADKKLAATVSVGMVAPKKPAIRSITCSTSASGQEAPLVIRIFTGVWSGRKSRVSNSCLVWKL